jgi:hypothetical protein
VIDAFEATSLGLNILTLDVTDELWQRIWLLRCMYAYDARNAGLMKIFEGSRVSNSLRGAAPTTI